MLQKILSKQILWVIIGIPFLSYLVLKPSFHLSLFGDDWEQLYFMWLEFESRHSLNWFDLRSYLGPYNFSYSYLGVLNHFFGLNSVAYFIASYIFRVMATISIYLMVNFISKEKLAGFLASMLFIFSAAGLETTNWVFNMNTYLGIVLFNLSLVFYLKSRSQTKQSIKNLIFFIPLFFLSLVVVATRLHGAIPFIILIDLFLILFFEKKKPNRYFFLRISIPVLILIFAMYIGAFGHLGTGGFTDRLITGFNIASDSMAQGNNMFLFFFPGLIGQIALPDYTVNLLVGSFGLILTLIIYLGILALLIFFTLSIVKVPKASNMKALISFFSFSAIWIFLVFIFSRSVPPVYSDKLFSIIIGGETLFFIGWLFLILKKSYPTISFTLMFSLFWLISFTLIYWLFTPTVFFEIPAILGTSNRYLIMGAVGFAIFFGTFTSFLIKQIKPNFIAIPFIILFFWLSFNFLAGHRYLAIQETGRNSQLSNSIWSSLISSISNLDIQNPTVFFFTADDPYILYLNIEFGFPSHMGLTYKIPELNHTPVSVTDYPTLLSYAKDGSPLQKIHGRPIKEVPLDHIYAYHLTNGKLISQTDLVREKLREDLDKLTSQ